MKIAIAGIAVAATLAGGTTVACASTAVNWKARTCAQANTWAAHRTTANLDALVVDSFHVPWRYLAGDVDQLYNDVRRGAAAHVLTTDIKYLREDCQA